MIEDIDRILYRPIGVISTEEGEIEFISSFHENSTNASSFILSQRDCHFDAWDFVDGVATCSSLYNIFKWCQYAHKKYETV